MRKIAFIGAGSFVFTRNLVRDLITYPAFADAELALMDIDAKRLAWIEKACKRIVSESGTAAKITATLDRERALDGADGVVSTILIGGLPVFRPDLEIPMEYGVKYCIGDTRGVPAIFRFLRTAPVLLSICDDIERLCPNAVFLNYSNPMTMNCMVMQRTHPSLTVTGLCHSVQGTAQMLADWIGADMSRVGYVCAGINHQAFYTRFEVDGQDAYPAIREALAASAELREKEVVRNKLFEMLGYYVTESSGHGSEYVPWFRKTEADLQKYCYHGTSWNPGETAFSVKRHSERFDRWEEDTAKWFSEPIDLARGNEYAANIFNAIFGDGTLYCFNGNVMNEGLIDNLPAGFCVEVPMTASRAGLQASHVGSLPPQLVPPISASGECEALAVEAYLRGSRRMVYQSVLCDPLTAAILEPDQIEEMTNRLFDCNRGWIDERFY